jgi:hypothetical protein
MIVEDGRLGLAVNGHVLQVPAQARSPIGFALRMATCGTAMQEAGK